MRIHDRQQCSNCGGTASDGVAICRSCAEQARCVMCHGPSYRVSLLDDHIEQLDHRECQLLLAAA